MSKKSKATSTLFLYRRLPYEHLPDHHGDGINGANSAADIIFEKTHTFLVLTQIVRIVQNTIQLRRQYKLFQAQLGQLDDITQEDLDMQRRAYRLIVDYLERHEK